MLALVHTWWKKTATNYYVCVCVFFSYCAFQTNFWLTMRFQWGVSLDFRRVENVVVELLNRAGLPFGFWQLILIIILMFDSHTFIKLNTQWHARYELIHATCHELIIQLYRYDNTTPIGNIFCSKSNDIFSSLFCISACIFDKCSPLFSLRSVISLIIRFDTLLKYVSLSDQFRSMMRGPDER